MRVVSLVPSATETLLAWGIEPVAVTRFCELGDRYPTVGGTKDPDIEAIAAARPDVVVMCDQENRLPDAEELRARNICVHVISITTLGHVGPQMRDLALAVGVAPSRGDACGVAPGEDEPIAAVAYVPIWKRPWMSIGADTYGGSLLRALGVALVNDGTMDRYPCIDPEQARVAGATCVLAPTEPYPFAERHRSTLEVVGPVTFVDGQDLFWWGARTPLALERLRRALRS
jgi:ABC-type Fe3+-hydroxamate transport system substrate-binding protein